MKEMNEGDYTVADRFKVLSLCLLSLMGAIVFFVVYLASKAGNEEDKPAKW